MKKANAPTPKQVAKARSAARAALDFDPKSKPLTEIGSGIVGLEMTRLQVRLPNSRDRTVDQALAGDRVAWRACCEEAAQEVRHGRPLNGKLAEFVGQLLDEAAGRPKGKKGSSLAWRDSRIVHAIECAIAKGVRAQRNDTKRDEGEPANNACAIVSEILREKGVPVSEGAVEQIWKRRPTVRVRPRTNARRVGR